MCISPHHRVTTERQMPIQYKINDCYLDILEDKASQLEIVNFLLEDVFNQSSNIIFPGRILTYALYKSVLSN
jgi:hypothetical protein